MPTCALTVSATTRSPREGEEEGVAYYFLNDEQFTQLVDEDAFLEWAYVHDHRYGTLKQEITRLMDTGSSVILEIDPQGAFHVQEVYPDAVLIFIEPPSLEVLEERLRSRGSETDASLALRMKDAAQEMKLKSRYAACVVNDNLERATEELQKLINMYESKERM